ncbi:MAG: hypothetical protein ACK4FS_05040 [Flavobacterium sp.]
MKKSFTFWNVMASAFMIYIGYRLLFIHHQSDVLPKFVTMGLGVFILLISISGVIARLVNNYNKKDTND